MAGHRAAAVAAAILAVGAGIPASASAAANLVQNGSFETPNAGSGFTTFGTGANMGGWTVSSGSVDLLGTDWQAADGVQSVDMSGNGPGEITQTLATSPGTQYTVSYALAGNPACAPAVKQIEVHWNGALADTESFDTTGHSTSDMGWATKTFTATATSSSTPLTFTSLTNSVCGPALDNVSVLGTTHSVSGSGQTNPGTGFPVNSFAISTNTGTLSYTDTDGHAFNGTITCFVVNGSAATIVARDASTGLEDQTMVQDGGTSDKLMNTLFDPSKLTKSARTKLEACSDPNTTALGKRGALPGGDVIQLT
jgi:choice-of-anchor C domain-containing protein